MPVNRYKNHEINSDFFDTVVTEKCGGKLVEIMATYGDAYSIKNKSVHTREPLQFNIPSSCNNNEKEVDCDMSFTGVGSTAKGFFVSYSHRPFLIFYILG
jgi:hypothetical protein